MKKQILAIGLAVLVAGSSLYAFGGFDRGFGCTGKMFGKPFMKSQGDGIYGVMLVVSDMDLTSSQWAEVKKVMLDVKKERLDSSENYPQAIFKSDGLFDKEKFIEERTATSKKMIEAQAKAVEKIVSILDNSQRDTLISKLQKRDN